MLTSAIAWKLWPETEVLQEVDDATIHHRGFWLNWKTSAELKKFFGLSDNPAMSCHPVCRQVTKSSCLFSWRLAALKKSSWPNWSKLTMIGRPRGPRLSVPCYSNIDSTIWRQLQRIPRKVPAPASQLNVGKLPRKHASFPTRPYLFLPQAKKQSQRPRGCKIQHREIKNYELSKNDKWTIGCEVGKSAQQKGDVGEGTKEQNIFE
jgi:hypothetical protein